MPVGGNAKRIRSEVRAHLTVGERIVFCSTIVLTLVLPLAAVELLLFGGHGVRGVGVGLLFLTLVVWVVPWGPILRARVRKREKRVE